MIDDAISNAIGRMRVIRDLKASEENDFTIRKSDGVLNQLKEMTSFLQIGTIVIALLTLLGAAIGLMNIMLVTVTERTKEIGVRKVLGSSVSGIVKLLSKDFIRLILVSLFIAGPIAWWMMRNWLQNFAYKVEINWWVFAIAGFTAIGIALLTVSFQAIKAAIANPVKSLRTE